MYQIKEFEFLASEVASITGSILEGNDIACTSIQDISAPKEGALMMCYPKNAHLLTTIDVPCVVFVTKDTVVENEFITSIVSDNPKFDFFDFINNYLISETRGWVESTISKSSEQYPNVEFGYNVVVGKNAVISPGTKIGSNTIIGCNVVIRSNVTIGENCVLKDNCTIGSEGFGYTRKENKVIHVPQLGAIRIGNNVVIGSSCTVERPALGFTDISNNVKIDDLVQIGHNQTIGEGTMIATGFKAVGGCHIGSNSFIGMGVTVTSKQASIGNNCLIGAGTVLTKPVSDNSVVYNKLDLKVSVDSSKLDNMLGTPTKNII